MRVIKTINDILTLTSPYEQKNLTFFKEVGGLIVHQEDLFSKYIHVVKSYLKEFIVDDNTRKKYSYDPERLSIDVYQTPHLDWMILRINGYDSPSRFLLGNKIKMIPPGDVEKLFDILLSKNVDELRGNHSTFDIE